MNMAWRSIIMSVFILLMEWSGAGCGFFLASLLIFFVVTNPSNKEKTSWKIQLRSLADRMSLI